MEPKDVQPPKAEPELSAAALLFDENHSRGFKNTKIDFNPSQERHVSPDERIPNLERSKSKDRGNSLGGTIGRYGTNRGIGVAEKTNYGQRHRMRHL